MFNTTGVGASTNQHLVRPTFDVKAKLTDCIELSKIFKEILPLITQLIAQREEQEQLNYLDEKYVVNLTRDKKIENFIEKVKNELSILKVLFGNKEFLHVLRISFEDQYIIDGLKKFIETENTEYLNIELENAVRVANFYKDKQ